MPRGPAVTKPLPFCLCGCGQKVLRGHRRWRAGHEPRSVRSEGGRIGRRNFAFRRRRIVFAAAVAQLAGRTVTKEDLLAVFADIDRKAYRRGYRACEDKWSGRQWWKKKQDDPAA